LLLVEELVLAVGFSAQLLGQAFTLLDVEVELEFLADELRERLVLDEVGDFNPAKLFVNLEA